MARRRRDHSKEQYWRRHVAAWRRSGQSVRVYCRAEGLSEPSFYSWRRLLAERDSSVPAGTERAGGSGASVSSAAARRRRADAVEVSPFVPVRLVTEATTTAAVEVVLRGGRVVRVAAGFVAQTLRDVVAALEELPC
jgi:transposase-like protein